jgi:hypothetical protein
MAAVRRSSDSGLIVALVIFVIFAVACLGGAVWFYQQFDKVKTATGRVQSDFDTKVNSVFAQQGWPLDKQTPDEWGIRFVGESFDDVALKLKAAAEYEDLQDSLLGWNSIEGARQAVEEAGLQTVAAERGEGAFTTLRGLLEGYEIDHQALTTQANDLQTKNDALTTERDRIRARTEQDLADLRRQNTQVVADYNKKAGDLTAANTDLNNRVGELTRELEDSRRRHQEEMDARRRDVTDLKAEVDKWRDKYEEAVAGPGEREVLMADGKVLEVDSKYDFVVIEGGENSDVKANDRYVVYSVTPDGRNKKKGVVLVGQVRDVTSVATIASEEPGSYILKGDKYVSQARWSQFYREQQAGAGAGS